MNKKIITALLSVALGMGTGIYIESLPDSTLGGHFISNSSVVIVSKKQQFYMKAYRDLELKINNNYDLLYISSDQVGFTSSGSYQLSNEIISLNEDHHDQIIPDRELTFYEKIMISERSVLSSDAMQFFPLNNDEFLLMSQHSLLHFCKKLSCSNLENYSNK